MHASEVREEVGVVAPEVCKELRILVYTQELADDLDGEHFRTTERGGRPAPSEMSKVLDPVVDEAEVGNDEGAKIHKRRPPLRLFGAIWLNTERREVFCVAQVLIEARTWG
jgi:hypothetical protein